MNYRLAMPNSEFIVFLSLNSDPDYFCHEIGHRRTLSCELAKRTFKWAKIRHYQRLPSIDTLLKRPVSYNSTPATPDYRFPLQGMAPSTSRQQKSRTCVLICEEKGFQVDLNVIQSISRTAKKLLPRVPYKRGPYYLNVRNGSLETLRIFVDFINGKRTWHGTKKLVCLDELRRFAFGELSYRDEWKSSEMKKLLIGLDVSKSSLCALCVSQSVRAKLPRSKAK
ncbi:Hypothetical protein NTJ_13027 [Nesidiocoris tenuis]|nr:Hypothetical protein NTJ_13027 [Nesidiocoris tenuis]